MGYHVQLVLGCATIGLVISEIKTFINIYYLITLSSLNIKFNKHLLELKLNLARNRSTKPFEMKDLEDVLSKSKKLGHINF